MHWDYADAPAPVYAVDVFEWRYGDGVLAPYPLGRRCLTVEDAQHLIRCP